MAKMVSDQNPESMLIDEQERRLHPFSWLFVLVSQLRPMLFPLLLLIIFGRGEKWELFGLVGAIVFALYALVYSLGFRYRIGERELVVREGIFARTERHVPYERIQNIVQKRTLLHRLFGVTELRLESAGGKRPEAMMNVIRVDEARRIEHILRDHSKLDLGASTAAAESAPLHSLEASELIKLGLVNNRGMVAIGALTALYWQTVPTDWRFSRHLSSWFEQLSEMWFGAAPGFFLNAVSALILLLALWLSLKVLSIAMAFLSFYGFRLKVKDTRVSTEAGLLTRHVANARFDKIQRILIGENWLSRRLGRRWLSCEVAAGGEANAENESLRLRWLAPLALPEDISRIIATLTPGLDIQCLQWRPLHPNAWRRVFKSSLLLWSAPLPAALWMFGIWAGVLWLIIAALVYAYARGWARFSAYAYEADVIAFRAGWLSRQWTVAKIAKGQTVTFATSPFDRRHHMASISVDTAGAGASNLALSIPYLPHAEASALAECLRHRLAMELAADEGRATIVSTQR